MSPLAILFAAAAVSAPAQAPTDAERLAQAVVPAPMPVARISRFEPRDPLPPGVARTSVELRRDDGLGGAFGFLCGLKPGAEKSGAAAVHGYDPTGRFVGARLSFAFR